jgi:hypothetical protein
MSLSAKGKLTSCETKLAVHAGTCANFVALEMLVNIHSRLS